MITLMFVEDIVLNKCCQHELYGRMSCNSRRDALVIMACLQDERMSCGEVSDVCCPKLYGSSQALMLSSTNMGVIKNSLKNYIQNPNSIVEMAIQSLHIVCLQIANLQAKEYA